MISVIIPVYNAANKGLESCLQRVAEQTYSDMQVLLVDDGSTDDSGRICDEWNLRDSRFEVIHQKNQGPAAARNTALALVEGDEIAFVDCDDSPDVNLLQVLFEKLVSHDADMVMACYNGISVSQMKLSDGFLSGNELLLGLFDYYTPLHKCLFAKLYRRELIDDLKFCDLRTAEDVDFLSRVYLRVKRCAFVDQSLYIYKRYEDSIMHTQTAQDYLDILQCYEGMVERLLSADEHLYGRSLDALIRKVVSSRYRNRAFGDDVLRTRIDLLEKKYMPSYLKCKNGSLLVKLGLLTCLKLPWLHALIMNYRER